MKAHALAVAAGLLVLAAHLAAQPAAAQEKQAEEYTPKTLEEKKSYLIGHNIGSTFRSQMLQPDLTIVLKGILAGLSGEKSKIADDELEKVMMAIQEEMASRHKKAGDDFLAKTAKDPDVTTLKSGLQYKVVKKGTGKSPKADDNVGIHYRGTLISGVVFDETDTAGKPANLFVNELIKGFSEALQLMKEGDKWQLFIPTELAYGAKPPPNIPPNAALIFELELVKVNGPAKAP
jgi:FKBP-type peptidyl-prolyl cis-trans isomerase